MKTSEAHAILNLLAAGFHRENLPPDSVDLWVSVLEPMDADEASRVALAWATGEDRFPSINQFKHAYRLEKGALAQNHNPVVATDEFGLPVAGCPEWVERWKQARRAALASGDTLAAQLERGDWRVFPEQVVDAKYHDDPRYTSAEVKAIGAMPETEWTTD